MSSVATVRRQLKIKTGSLNRLVKEHKMYTQEADDLRVKLDKLIGSNVEEWDVKNARKMLAESQRMIERGQELQNKALSDLDDIVDAATAEPEITEDDPDLKAAKEALVNAKS